LVLVLTHAGMAFMPPVKALIMGFDGAALLFPAMLVRRFRRDKAAVGLAVATLALARIFANNLFTLHHANVRHLSATPAAAGPGFPETKHRRIIGMLPVSRFVPGMTFQVFDVVVASKRLRRIALGQAVLAFVFSIGIAALTAGLAVAAPGG
jgi:uncharacterized membrane protein